MASTTTNLQKMAQSAKEFENISVSLFSNFSKLSEIMEELKSKWHGEAANNYLDSFHRHSPDLEQIAVVMDEAATSLHSAGAAYTRAESSAADIIRSTLGKG